MARLKLLLDTHIWLWSLTTPTRLGSQVRSLLEGGAAELWLSPISTWEALLLLSKGRLELGTDPSGTLARARAHFREASLTHEMACAAVDLPFLHSDPGDRFLAATAYVLGLTLVTADTKLLAMPGIRTLGNV